MKNQHHTFFRSASNVPKTPPKIYNNETEDVYKLNFHHVTYSQKKEKDFFFPKFIHNQAAETQELYNSINKVKKFLPSIVNLMNISKNQKTETMLIERFEHQEFEKILKNEIKKVTEKKEELKNIILKKREEIKKLEDKISEIELSSKNLINMDKTFRKTENKKKVFSRLSTKEISSPNFNNLMNINNNLNVNENNLNTDNETRNEKNNKSFLRKVSEINIIDMRKSYVPNYDSIFNSTENKKDNENKLKNLSFQKYMYQNSQQVLKLKKILPQIKIDRSKLSLEIQNLEKEKNELNEKKENLIDHLYVFYLNLLKEGKDTRNEGLSWIIKEIFLLKRKVLFSYIPKYLDNYSIEYIFKHAKLNILLDNYENQIKKIREELSDLDLIKNPSKNNLKLKIALKNNDIYKSKNLIRREINKNENIINKTEPNFTNDNSTNIISFNMNQNDNKTYYYKTKSNILNDFPKLNSTDRTNFTNNYNVHKEEIPLNNNINGNINSQEDNFTKENKDNDIYTNINNDDNTYNNVTELSPNEEKNINKNISEDKNNSKYSLKKVLSNDNLNNNFYNYMKKAKMNHKFLKLNQKKLDLSHIELIPNILKLKDVKKYLDSKKPKINENNSGKIEQYFIINQRIRIIKTKLREIKNLEMKRIFEEYLKKGFYQDNLNEKEIVLSALIGQDNVLPELNKQMRDSRLYFESIKRCGLNPSFSKNHQIKQINSILLEKNLNNKNNIE